jgi:hypothetical protein
MARIGAQLERAGHRVLSEREIFARERAEGKRVLSAELNGGRHHRPDLVLLDEPDTAIEVELTDKSARRLDQLLRAWRRAVARGQFGCVRYLCSARALSYVERAAARTRTSELIEIEPLACRKGRLALPAESLRPGHEAPSLSPIGSAWEETDPADVLQGWAYGQRPAGAAS